MSEYGNHHKPIPDHPEQGAVFLFDSFEELENPVKPHKVTKTIEPEPGAFLDLTRRFDAAEVIVGYFNHTAKLEGAAKVRGVGGNVFDQRYEVRGKSGSMAYSGMQDKNAMLEQHYDEQLAVIAAPNALAKAGFSQEEIDHVYRAVERETHDFEPGASDAKHRAKKLKQFEKTAKNVKK